MIRLSLRPHSRSAWTSTTTVLALAAASVTLTVAGATGAEAATLPAPYAASSSSDLLHLNASLAGSSLADAMVGLSSADVDSGRASGNSTAHSANVNATVAGLALPIDSVAASAPPTVPNHTRTLLPVDLSPVANVGAINGAVQAAYLDGTSCVAATNGTAVLSASRTDVAGVTLLSPNQAVNTALSLLGINSLGSVAASWVSSETDLVNRGGGSTISDVRSTSQSSIGDITLLNNAVTVHVASPVTLQANSDGTTGTAGLLNAPTITATVGASVIPIPLNGQPIAIALPGSLATLVSLSITAFQPTNGSSGATGAATLQSLLRVQLGLLNGAATVDLNVAPMAVTAAAPAGGVDCRPAAATITSPANGSVTNNATPAVSGTAEPGTTVTVTEGTTTVCTATVAANGTWSCTPTTPLGEGQHTLSATSTNAAGLSSTPVSTTFTVDTVPPNAPVITSPTDGATVTDGGAPISGTAEPGSTVKVTDGTTPVCTATADASGVWSCTPATPLTDGSHSLTATATDAAGNTGAPSAPVHITVAPPAAPAITSPSSGSTITTGSPTISGTGVPGSTVTVDDGSTVVCTATVAADGTWSCTPTTPLGDGTHTLTATTTSGGRTSAPSAPVTVTVNTKVPAAPVITSPANGSTTTNGSAPISGTAKPGSTVKVLDGTTPVCSATANASGAWTCTPTSPLAGGTHSLTATATDGSGNVSAPSNTVNVTVVPVAPVITSPANGASVSDGRSPIKGTAPAGSTVTVLEGSTVVCTATTTSAGAWTCAPSPGLSVGQHTIRATASDATGNTSVASAPRTFTVTQRTYIGLTWDHNPLKVGARNRITFATHPASDVTGTLIIRITGAGLNISKRITLTHAMGGVVNMYVTPTTRGNVSVQASYLGNATCRPSSVSATFLAR